MALSVEKFDTVSFLLMATLLLSSSFRTAEAKSEEDAAKCSATGAGECRNKAKALRLNYIAIACILAASMIGVCSPLFTNAIPALHPDKDLFILVKAFASGVIIATGFMHVMPDSWNDLTSPCLPESPWRVFPFTPFITMVSAYLTMMMDTFAMSFYVKNLSSTGGNGEASSEIGDNSEKVEDGNAMGSRNGCGHGHGHGHGQVIALVLGNKESLLLEKRVIAQVLELGIVVHSVVIGLSMGASDNYCTIRPLIAAMCFHQLFEGMGLGGCITQAEYGFKMKAILAFFFSVTTPAGIIMGILMQQVYKENSPTALIVVGVLNAVSAGLLIYMALVDVLAAEFKGPKLQKNIKLQSFCYVVALMGTGLMSLMAKWA